MAGKHDEIVPPQLCDGIVFSEEQLDDLRRLAATGMSAKDIAGMLELSDKDVAQFVEMASMPLSRIARLIAEGRAYGTAQPQLNALEAAEGGNLQAVHILMKYQDRNRFRELIASADDDEFTI